MPVASTEATRTHRFVTAALRWLPLPILGAVLAAALVVIVEREGPARPAGGPPPTLVATPVLSIRRSMTPLVDAVADRRLRSAIDEFVATQPADTCLVVEVGDTVVRHRADDPQAPASLQKLLTGAAVLLSAGSSARLRTEALAVAPLDEGLLDGDLYVRGGGDPLLASAEYAARFDRQPQLVSDLGALADAIVESGIREVRGSVIGDESRYDSVRYDPQWPRRFVEQGQTGPLSALTVNDGFIAWPEGDGPGTPAASPAVAAAEAIVDALEARGVRVAGGAAAGLTPPDAMVLAEHESPPMVEVVGQMIRESDNGTAEMLLKELGVVEAGEGTSTAGAEAVRSVLRGSGVDVEGLVVDDGSGLAASNRASCAQIAEVLFRSDVAASLRNGLAAAGIDGTLHDRWLDTPLVGRVEAKTGTLNEVTALAGYADTADGPDAAFVLIVNVDAPDRISEETIAGQRRFAEILLSHPQRPDVAHLQPAAS